MVGGEIVRQFVEFYSRRDFDTVFCRRSASRDLSRPTLTDGTADDSGVGGPDEV